MAWRSSMSVTLLECAVTKNVPASPLECAVTKLLDLKSLGISSYKKLGGAVPMWGWRAYLTPSVGSQSLVNPMGFTVTQPFDSAGAGERRNQARGGSLLGAEIAAAWLQRGPSRGLALRPCRRHHPGVSRIAAENGVGTEARPIALG